MACELSGYLIRGACIGFSIEFPEVHEIHEDLRFSMVIDCLIFRLMLNIWKESE